MLCVLLVPSSQLCATIAVLTTTTVMTHRTNNNSRSSEGNKHILVFIRYPSLSLCHTHARWAPNKYEREAQVPKRAIMMSSQGGPRAFRGHGALAARASAPSPSGNDHRGSRPTPPRPTHEARPFFKLTSFILRFDDPQGRTSQGFACILRVFTLRT